MKQHDYYYTANRDFKASKPSAARKRFALQSLRSWLMDREDVLSQANMITLGLSWLTYAFRLVTPRGSMAEFALTIGHIIISVVVIILSLMVIAATTISRHHAMEETASRMGLC